MAGVLLEVEQFLERTAGRQDPAEADRVELARGALQPTPARPVEVLVQREVQKRALLQNTDTRTYTHRHTVTHIHIDRSSGR